MSGKIELKARKGISKDPRYTYYPEAYLEITGENGQKINISPTYKDLANLLLMFRKHELKIDLTRKRKLYTSKLIIMLKEAVDYLDTIELNEYDTKNMEAIYKEQK